ncbi:hypothetical protein [Streptomyces mirabilis]|uniref:hypothetical protein n=1 Tax=Streptomyces mirabilis TaxID=68239 RepID=UPI0036C57F97
MATLPTQDSYTAGVPVTAPVLNKNVRDALNFLLAPPQVLLTRSTSWTLASASNPRLITEWNSEIVDTDGMWNPTPNPSRLTAQTPGLYELTIFVHYPSALNGGSGNVICGIQLNANGGVWAGTPESRIAEDGRPLNNGTSPSSGTSSDLVVEQYMNAGDYVEFYAGQSSGSSASMGANAFSLFCAARWVASG